MKRVNVLPIQSDTAELKEEIELAKTETNKWSKLIIFKNITKEVLLNSTSHGIPNILRSNIIVIKLVWSFFLLASTALCSFLIAQSIMNYLSYDVNTKIRKIYEKPALFPVISICYKHKYATDYAIEFLNNVINMHKVPNIFNPKILSFLNYSQTLFVKDGLLLIANYESLKASFSDENRKKLAYELKDTLIDCVYDSNQGVCSEADFYWSYDKILGNCYTINSDKSNSTVFKYSNFFGNLFGLSITLFVGIKDELKAINPFLGLTVRIQNSSNEFNINTYDLSPGKQTNMEISRYFSYQLSKPYSVCDIDNDNPKTFSSDLYNQFIANNFKYNQQTCLGLCFQKLINQNCNCSNFMVPSFDSYLDFCDETSLSCQKGVFKLFSSIEYLNANCMPLCPLECNNTGFKVAISTSDIMPEYYSKVISEKIFRLNVTNRTLSLDEQKNSIVKLNIYYDSLSYTVLTETASLDIITLMSNIGGTLGLFLGVSLLTFVEFVEIILAFIFGI